MSKLARLGAFIVVTLALLAVGVFIVGSKRYLFQPTYQLKAQFDNVAGLSAGADVQIGGVHSGTVQGIELPNKPGGKVTVFIQLDQKTHEIVKADSLASIETEGLLGNQYLAISFGSEGEPELKNGDTIQSIPPLIMADMLKKADGILDSSQKAIENTTAATGHLNSVTAKIDAGQGTVGALVNDKTLYNNLEASTSDLQKTMVQAQAGVTDFQENMEALKHNFFLAGYYKKRGYEDSSELAANRISGLPRGTPLKSFSFSAKDLFDGRNSAKLKNQKTLRDVGEFLAQNPFGVAVIVASTGMEGDSKKDLELNEARAMVIREYLVESFGFDDTLLKTLGLAKQEAGINLSEWGSINIVIFPTGTQIPSDDTVQSSAPPVSGSSVTSAANARAAKQASENHSTSKQSGIDQEKGVR